MNFIKWFENPAFQNLYKAEESILRNGLGGDFQLLSDVFIDQKGRLAALGNLLYGEQKQLIQIIFPTRYPYVQPIITPLLEKPDGSQPDTPKMFGRGNQYGNGSMCLMRKDEWNKNEHNIGWTLRRSQQWLLRVSSKEGFKKEEIVDELPGVIAHQGQVLIPKDIILPDNLNTGIIILTQFKPNHYILEQNFISERTFSLDIGKEQFRWFRIKGGVTFRDIFTFDINVLLQNFINIGVTPNHVIGKNLALYFPDDSLKWHFFKFPLSAGQGPQMIYMISRNISNELYHRTKEIFDDQILKTKRVTLIGLGAIGSEVARSLARNGVGHFNLFDNDTFELGNSVRHAADIFYIGENKSEVAKKLILLSNPTITVNAYAIDVLDDNGLLEQSLLNSELCIVLTADDNVDYLINDIYKSLYNIPFVFARVSSGGLSGSVQVVQHNATACLRCLSMFDADKLPVPEKAPSFSELGPEYGNCSLPAVPGSELDTKEVALQVSRISIQLLLESHSSSYAKRLGSQYYWHGPYGSKNISAFTWEISNKKTHPNCDICN